MKSRKWIGVALAAFASILLCSHPVGAQVTPAADAPASDVPPPEEPVAGDPPDPYAGDAGNDEVQSAPAAVPPPPTTEAASCFPSCRSGHVCHRGQCVSACNPACGADEVCTGSGQCTLRPPSVRSTPGATNTSSTWNAPPPVAAAAGPGHVIVMPTLGVGWYGFGGISGGLGLGFGGTSRWFWFEPSFFYGPGKNHSWSAGGLLGFRSMSGTGGTRFSQFVGLDVRFRSDRYDDGWDTGYYDYLEFVPTFGAGLAFVGSHATQFLELVVGLGYAMDMGDDHYSYDNTGGFTAHTYLRWGVGF